MLSQNTTKPSGSQTTIWRLQDLNVHALVFLAKQTTCRHIGRTSSIENKSMPTLQHINKKTKQHINKNSALICNKTHTHTESTNRRVISVKLQPNIILYVTCFKYVFNLVASNVEKQTTHTNV